MRRGLDKTQAKLLGQKRKNYWYYITQQEKRAKYVGFLATFRSDQWIGQLIAEQDPSSPAAQKTVNKLKSAGSKAVPKIIDALAMSDKTHTMVLVDLLSSMINDKNLLLYKEGLADGNERVDRPGDDPLDQVLDEEHRSRRPLTGSRRRARRGTAA